MSERKLLGRALALVLSLIMVFGALPVMASEGYDNGEDAQLSSSEITANIEFDIKFILNPDIVLNADGSLSEEFVSSLGIDMDNFRLRRLDMQFMDTPDHFFFQHGWINRIRQRGWEDQWQIMNRRRAPLPWPVTEEGIESAVQQAIEDGFVYPEWHFEVDWSYDSATLTKTRQLGIPLFEGYARGDLLDVYSTREQYLAILPETLENMPWYDGQLNDIVIHGPAFYRRYEVRIDNIIDCPHFVGNNNFRIDVLQITAEDGVGVEFIVEASHANMDMAANLGLANATATRESLYDFLGGVESGVVLPMAGLRATTILNRYRGLNQEPAAYDNDETEDETEGETPAQPQPTVVRLAVGQEDYSVNGTYRTVAVAPFEAENVVMLPLRAVAEAFGAQASWDASARAANIIMDGVSASFQIGVGAAIIVNNLTFVPVHYVADVLGLNVTMDNGVIYIQK